PDVRGGTDAEPDRHHVREGDRAAHPPHPVPSGTGRRARTRLTVHGQWAGWHGARHDDRRDGLAVEQELVQYRLKVRDRRCVHLDEEAVLARDAVALADLVEGG